MTAAAAPVFWMHQNSAALAEAVCAYLGGIDLTAADIQMMRDYLRQWIEGGDWMGAAVPELRKGIDALTSRETIAAWLEAAEEMGIDPL